MKKAAQIRVDLYVEGVDEPENDFPREVKLLVRTMILSGAARLPHLKVIIRNVEEVKD
ncbi:MAG TPA: hypothetical protein VK619_10400 [Pyrinomonadaceae bacterium]|nr:hypothetical protein [Pyrinomonadaceae bacterium]